MIGARIVRVARGSLRSRLATSTDDADHVASEVVTKGMIRAGAPIARAIVRTFGPWCYSRRCTRDCADERYSFLCWHSVALRHAKFHASDVPLALADDFAYSAGVAKARGGPNRSKPSHHISRSRRSTCVNFWL